MNFVVLNPVDAVTEMHKPIPRPPQRFAASPMRGSGRNAVALIASSLAEPEPPDPE